MEKIQTAKIINKELNTNNFEIFIAKCYVFSLPCRLIVQLSFLQNIFGVCANYLPFVFHLFGLAIWALNDNGRIKIDSSKSDLIKHSGLLILYLNLSSVFMACVIQAAYGNHGSESAFQGILGMLVYYTQYFLMFLYNYRVSQLLSIETMNKLLHKTCRVLLFIGYFQVLVMNGIGGNLYDRINFFEILNSSSMLGKLSLTGFEGASAGSIIGIFVLPFLFSHIIKGEKGYIFETVLWIIPIFFTYSTTGYILVAADMCVLVYLLIRDSSKNRHGFKMLGLMTMAIISAVMLLQFTGSLNEEVKDEAHYLLFEKATDRENGSTVARTIPLIVNWNAFKEYPVLGVGNGLQGYFYEKYFPDWAFKVKGSNALDYLKGSRDEIANGAILFPSLLSGYGIAGCVLILIFIFKCIKENKRKKAYSTNLYYMYIVGGVAFIVSGFQSDFYGVYYVWFIISIPMMYFAKKDEEI